MKHLHVPVDIDNGGEVYTPRSGLNGSDMFSRISIAVSRQDPLLHDYRSRAKWTKSCGKYFVANADSREGKRLAIEEEAYRLYNELPVNEYFLLDQVLWDDNVASIGQMNGKMSADAPIFTPGMFSYAASTSAGTSGVVDSIRSRAYSDVIGGSVGVSRTERTMSAMAFLPPSALIEEGVAVREKSQSFWSKMRLPAATAEVGPDPPGWAERQESRPAECKQM
jgi:hypothetical protein